MVQAAAALKGLEAKAFDPDKLFQVAIHVHITKARTSKLLTPLGDLDNYAKGVLDAITKDGRWWTDDKLVSHLVVEKSFAVGEPGYDVTLIQKDP